MSYAAAHAALFAHLVLQHVLLVLSGAALALLVAVPLGVAVVDTAAADAVLALMSMIYTLPSLALFALLIPLTGLGAPTAVLVLALYAAMIFTRAVILGIRTLPGGARENARALGLSRMQRLRIVELPLALPVIISGSRTAVVVLIGTASIAAWIDGGGLGVLLFEGIRQDDMQRVVAGGVLTAALAVGADAGLSAWERRVSV